MTASIWGAPAAPGTVTTPEQGFENRNIVRNGAFAATGPTDSLVYSTTYLIQSAQPVPFLDSWSLSGVDAAGIFSASQGFPTVASSAINDSSFAGAFATSTVDAVLSAGRSYLAYQNIKWQDFNRSLFGTSAAKTLTLSFWAYSTLVGTHSGFLKNVEGTRSYPFSFTINAASTWEQKVIQIPGDTTASWYTTTPYLTNATVAVFGFCIGAASGLRNAANAWAGGNFVGVSGAINVIATGAAQLRVTQVQLEYGIVQTPFTIDTIEDIAQKTSTYNPYLQAPFRNRIINGDMRIDQRNSGAAVTINSTTLLYTVDRWAGYGEVTDGVFTLQKLAATPPAGFINYLRATITTADASIGAAQAYGIQQIIEGFNFADAGFGLATASPITVSFMVRSSLIGVFSGSLRNSAGNRTYPFVYTINVANTWEKKTITIPGDTTGTWLVDNGVGIRIDIDLGTGTTFRGPAGAWSASNLLGVTGAISLIATVSATLDLTGVQVELGNKTTPFEQRLYAVELILCQRYYEVGLYEIFSGNVTSASVYYFTGHFIVTKRATPVITGVTDFGSSGFAAGFPIFTGTGPFASSFRADKTSNATINGGYFAFSWAATAEL